MRSKLESKRHLVFGAATAIAIAVAVWWVILAFPSASLTDSSRSWDVTSVSCATTNGVRTIDIEVGSGEHFTVTVTSNGSARTATLAFGYHPGFSPNYGADEMIDGTASVSSEGDVTFTAMMSVGTLMAPAPHAVEGRVHCG